ncbi:MAG: hypothetical protein RMJ82_13450, partial [Gemmatales bacterium]|nr:hypothetical protein [Gemmatales bacterium]
MLAAARRLGRELARIRSGQDEPAPELVRAAIRDVITHCIYGVDKNPLAVDLCKVALWIEAHTEGKPLTFLDHRIRCGDSLLGVFDLAALKHGIPDDAFNPVSGDDKSAATAAKRQNREERAGIRELPFQPAQQLHHLADAARQLDQLPDDHPEHIRAKQQLYHSICHSPEAVRQRTAANLWTAAFFQPLASREQRTANPAPLITTGALADWLDGQPIDARLTAHANARAAQLRFFHWPLEFPEVFVQGGFDVILSNPPWERIKLQEQEFFATRDQRIAAAPNKAARQRLIDQLQQTNPALAAEFASAKHEHEAASKFVRASNRFPLTAVGDVNTYALFAELAARLLAPNGRAGIIVPTGIATDDTTKRFFQHIVATKSLVSLFGFDNTWRIFPAVHPDTPFALLTLGHSDSPIEFAHYLLDTAHLRDSRRRFTLSPDDFALLNPNTRTCPVFRTRADADLTRAIYRRVPVLVNETTGQNPWGFKGLLMF